MPIAFDTTGFQQRDQTSWYNPANGDQLTLTYFDRVPDLPASLEDLTRLRHDLAVITGEVGCLVEAHVVAVGGVPGLFQIVKLPIPNQPTGQAFIASFTLPKASCSVVLKLQAVERGMTGMREAMLVAQIGFDNWVRPHPYAPEVNGRLPFHVGDDPRYDPQFADHPLSRVRAWAHHIARTAHVDPRFAALPPFQPPVTTPGTGTPLPPVAAHQPGAPQAVGTPAEAVGTAVAQAHRHSEAPSTPQPAPQLATPASPQPAAFAPPQPPASAAPQDATPAPTQSASPSLQPATSAAPQDLPQPGQQPTPPATGVAHPVAPAAASAAPTPAASVPAPEAPPAPVAATPQPNQQPSSATTPASPSAPAAQPSSAAPAPATPPVTPPSISHSPDSPAFGTPAVQTTPPPTPAVGATLTTVVPGIPIGGILPLWLGDDDVSFWRMEQPEALLGKLAQGVLARFPILDNRFRDVVALDADSSTVMLTGRYRGEDGGVPAEMASLTRVTADEAIAAATPDAVKEAFAWIGRASYAAAERGEYLCVEPGGVTYREKPYALMIVTEQNGQWYSLVETSPLPKGAPVWQDQQQPGSDTDGQTLGGPASRETVEAGGTLAMFAISTWALHWLQLALSFGPARR